MADAFPATLAGPTSKERKYDRQLRLWAATGQQALEDARVLLVNSDGPLGSSSTGVTGVAGVETLKNLVLPGIGGFTIVDPATVTEADLGVNFFLEEESLGKSRADETCRLLRELNPDVQGYSYSEVCCHLLFANFYITSHSHLSSQLMTYYKTQAFCPSTSWSSFLVQPSVLHWTRSAGRLGSWASQSYTFTQSASMQHSHLNWRQNSPSWKLTLTLKQHKICVF